MYNRTKEKKMYHFIINSTASSGKVMRTWKRYREILMEHTVKFAEHFPSSASECIECVRSLKGHHIVAVGGDGSLNTVLQGIEDFEYTRLSCLPLGSGNDFAKALHISKRPVKALRHLIENPVELTMDYGEINFTDADSGMQRTARFAISSGLGYDAEICEAIDRSRAKRVLNSIGLGKLIYLVKGSARMFSFRRNFGKTPCTANIVMDDGRELTLPNMFLCVAMNTPFQGGGMPFCPQADWTDGLLDICCADSMPVAKLMAAIMLVYARKHFIFKQVHHFRCKSISIKCSVPRFIHTDGDARFKTDSFSARIRTGLHLVY